MSRLNRSGWVARAYSILEVPFIYSIISTILAPGAKGRLTPFFKRVFNRPAGRVLDVGCGPASRTPEPETLLVGVDVNERYVRKYTGGFLDTDAKQISSPPAGRRRMGFVVSSVSLPFEDGSFDEIRTCAVFHHLTDEEVGKSVQEMDRCLRPGGRLVVLDAVYPKHPWKRPIAWFTLRMDRGRNMRYQEKLLRLCQEACAGNWEWERYTYTYTGMEFLYLQRVKS